jgi:hypothetical protein
VRRIYHRPRVSRSPACCSPSGCRSPARPSTDFRFGRPGGVLRGSRPCPEKAWWGADRQCHVRGPGAAVRGTDSTAVASDSTGGNTRRVRSSSISRT